MTNNNRDHYQLHADLQSMRGVWVDELVAYDLSGSIMTHDPFGGSPGPFPYTNLVYVDLQGDRYTQTNVAIAGRPFHARTFQATVRDGMLTFDPLGPDAPIHVGVSGGPGLIWFVAKDNQAPGLANYAEPDLIRLEGDRRWRTTILYRGGQVVRPMLVTGQRVSPDPTTLHQLDPRRQPIAPDASVTSTVHDGHTTTTQYRQPTAHPEGKPNNP
jgi:hypothetical protein